MSKHLLQKFTLLILSLGFALSINAQVTTSGISGTVTDKATKETLIGATVVAKHLPTGTTYGAITNEKGNYALNGLRPGGPYTLEVSYIGYNKKVFKGITLSLGNTEYLNVWLGEDAQQLAQVFVIGSKNASFNARRTGAASNFSRKAIELAPNVNRSLFDVAKLTPQANVSGGGISFAGGNNRYNSFQIDGAVSNDVFGLTSAGTNGGKAGTNPISLEAIDALQVVIAPFDVRQGGFTGGGINAVTKSGTNTFHGSAYEFYTNQDLYGETAGSEDEVKELYKYEKDKTSRRKLVKQFDNTAGFTFGGPIIKDKLFFFVNAEYAHSMFPSPYGIGNGSKIKKEFAEKVGKKFKELTGSDAGGFDGMDLPTKSYKALARLDWNISRAHKFSLRYSYLNASKQFYEPKYNRLDFHSAGYDYTSKTHSIVGELNSRFNNKVSNELRVGYTRVRDKRDIGSELYPSVYVQDGRNSVLIGTDPYSGANQLDQDVFTFSDNLTFNLGNHSVVLGTSNEFYDIYNLFIPNFTGKYTYSSLADFESVGTANEKLPNSYSYQESITGSHLWGPRFRAMQLGFYLQDEWKVTDEFRLTYGLRMDMPIFLDKPNANDDFNKSDLAKKYGIVNNAVPESKPLWSPRIGFRYDIGNEHKYYIRGGAGIFTGRIPFVWISNVYGNSGVEFSSTELRQGWKNFPKDFKFNKDPMKQYVAKTGKKPTTELDFLSPKFTFPQVARFNLAFDATLPGGIKATLEGMFTKNMNNILYQNYNLEKKGTVKIGNSERPTWAKVDENHTYLLMLDNTDTGYSYNLSASLSKSFNFGLNASLAYTYGHTFSGMDGGSSIGSSNWRFEPIVSATQDAPMSHSMFDLGHRVVANLSYSKDYAKHFGTTIAIIYNGQSGRRFSMTYKGDLNGDGSNANDLVYIPTDKEIALMPFKKADQAEKFTKFIHSNEQLERLQGQTPKRNSMITPFVNQFDLHFAQNFYFNIGKRRQTIQLNADVVNIGNMFNHTWGVHYGVPHGNLSLMKYENGQFDFRPMKTMWGMSDISSRWHAQVGIKYIF